jgi:hypothetical protein
VPELEECDWEFELEAHCRQANLTPLQTEIVLLHLCDGMTLAQVRLKLKIKRMADLKREWGIACSRLSAAVPGFWEAANAFPRELTFCAADRRVYDLRPTGMRGVATAPEANGFRAGPVVPSDDARLRQTDKEAAARLWAAKHRPCEVSSPALA